MNEVKEMEMDLEIVELGDAKEETKGVFSGTVSEQHPTLHFKPAV